MVGWHHQFNGHELGQTPGDSEGQGGLVCCSPWGRKESDMTQRLNNNNNRKRESHPWSFYPILAKRFLLLGVCSNVMRISSWLTTISSIAHYFRFTPRTPPSREPRMVDKYAVTGLSSLLAVPGADREPGVRMECTPWALDNCWIHALSLSFTCFILCFLLRICIDFVEHCSEL